MTASLVLENVHVGIGDAEVISGVSLALIRGRATGLVGESGSGKTMTVRVATGMLPTIGGRITRGTVMIEGQEMTRASNRRWGSVRGEKIALVPQNSLSSLDPIMTIGHQMRETLVHAAHVRSWRSEASNLLRQVHLDPSPRLLDGYPHQLSGGMRQRVVIALALATRPTILVADEPTTALDASVRSEILALLNEMRAERGLAVLLVSHDLAAIKTATDDVMVMYRGKVVETGPTSEVIATPQHPYTRALLLARPELTPPGQPIPITSAGSFEAQERVDHALMLQVASGARA